MKISQFVIEESFWVGARKFHCTDVCSNFIAAIELRFGTDPRNYNGPIYGVPEYAFDESEIESCTEEPRSDALKEWESGGPGETVVVVGVPKVEVSYSLSVCPIPEGMERKDFAIGDLFLCGRHIMRCIDIGTRVVVGLDLCHADERLKESTGQPYSPEWIIDEDEMCACTALYCLPDEELSWLRSNGKRGFGPGSVAGQSGHLTGLIPPRRTFAAATRSS